MGNLNHDLFEEFKHLEKLCGEIYGEQHGVTHYIDDMKMVPESDGSVASIFPAKPAQDKAKEP